MAWNDYSFYNNLLGKVSTAERSLVDKALARRNVEKIEDLLRKDEWTREDVKLLLNYLVSDELKLLYLRDWDRYILGKYFVWLREIVRVGEDYYDIEESIKRRIEQLKNKQLTENEDEDARKAAIEEYKNRLKVLKRIEKGFISSIQFAVDIFLYIGRSSLSLYGKAFDSLLKPHTEYEYSEAAQNLPSFENYLKGGK